MRDGSSRGDGNDSHKAMCGVLSRVPCNVPAQEPGAPAPPSEPEPEVVEEPAPVIHDDAGDVLLHKPVGEDILVTLPWPPTPSVVALPKVAASRIPCHDGRPALPSYS